MSSAAHREALLLAVAVFPTITVRTVALNDFVTSGRGPGKKPFNVSDGGFVLSFRRVGLAFVVVSIVRHHIFLSLHAVAPSALGSIAAHYANP